MTGDLSASKTYYTESLQEVKKWGLEENSSVTEDALRRVTRALKESTATSDAVAFTPHASSSNAHDTESS